MKIGQKTRVIADAIIEQNVGLRRGDSGKTE